MNLPRNAHIVVLSLTNCKLKSPELLHGWWEKCKVVASSSTVCRLRLLLDPRPCKALRKRVMTDASDRGVSQFRGKGMSAFCCATISIDQASISMELNNRVKDLLARSLNYTAIASEEVCAPSRPPMLSRWHMMSVLVS